MFVLFFSLSGASELSLGRNKTFSAGVKLYYSLRAQKFKP